MSSLIEIIHEGLRVEAHRPWPRAIVTPGTWNLASQQLAKGRLILLGLWGDVGTVNMALLDEAPFAIGVVTLSAVVATGQPASPQNGGLGLSQDRLNKVKQILKDSAFNAAEEQYLNRALPNTTISMDQALKASQSFGDVQNQGNEHGDQNGNGGWQPIGPAVGGRSARRQVMWEIHCWLLPPLQVHSSTRAPSAVDAPVTSRHSPDCAPVIVPLELKFHCWLACPLHDQTMITSGLPVIPPGPMPSAEITSYKPT